MGKVFILDVEKCNGCYDCLIACNERNFGAELAGFDMAHPYLGQFLMKIEEHLYGDPPLVKQYFLVRPCMHCRNAPCAQCCPVDAIHINEHGLVELVEDECISCRLCVYACPYEAVFFEEKNGIVRKCSGCSEIIREGKTPACVSACERNAIIFGDEEDLSQLLGDSERMIAEDGMDPRVYYRNVP